MSFNLNKVRDFFKSTPLSDSAEIHPELGFKLTYFEQTKQLVVKVIGGRHFPTVYGSAKPEGYLVKVRVYPGREKYETDIVKESWPNFNQDLTFDLQPTLTTIKEQFLGKFVTLTVYAILGTQDSNAKLKRTNSLRNSFRFLTGKEENVEIRKNSTSSFAANRFTFNNRRTVGAVTYKLDPKKFSQKHKLNYATPDIWREVQNIASGIEFDKKETKCTIEISLTYFNSENGNNDRIQVTLSKLRCSMQTMMEHEKYGGSLYLKMTAFEYGVKIASWKSDRFDPTISLKIEPTTAMMQAIFKDYNLRNIRIYVRILCKTKLGKKTQLGKLEIDADADMFKQIVENPTISVTRSLELV